MKQKLILLTLVIGLTIVSQSTLSLGMGNIQVYSSLDEQLRSTIELITSSEEDLQNLTVKLATSADYKKVGLDKSFVPINLMVSLDEDNPNLVNVTSNGPISEPIISLLLDVNWNNGRILREFTILLDPPTYDVPATNVQVNNVVVEPIQEQVIEEPVLQPQEETAAEPQTMFTNEDVAKYEQPETVESTMAEAVVEIEDVKANEDVYVNEGDTLWAIAQNNKLGGLSTNQMMMAIYNNNSGSFIDNNINKLIKGSQLNMPTLMQAEAISYSEALAQVESHHQSWAPKQQDYSSYQTTEDTYADESDTSSTLDYGVQLSGGDSEGSDSGQTNAEVGDSEAGQLSDEEQFNQASESDDLQQRISELEGIVEQQQAVLEVDDDSLANLESQLGEVSDDVDSTMDETTAVVDDVWDETVDQLAGDVDQETMDSSADSFLDIDSVDTSDAGDVALDTSDEMNVDSTDDTSGVEESTADISDETINTAPAKFSATVNQEPSMVDKTVNWVMDNLKWVLLGLGALVLLLIVPRFLKRGGDEEDETSFLDDIKQRKADAADAAEPDDDVYESVDTKVNQPLDTEDSDDGFSDHDEESDDVLAELDKSIAFDENEADDTLDDVFDSEELSANESDDFDLDGFLNDGDNDTSVTKDHAITLAVGDIADESDDEVEVKDTDNAFEEVLFDDLGMDLDDEISDAVDKVEEATDDVVNEAVEETEESLDLDDELEELDLDDLEADDEDAHSEQQVSPNQADAKDDEEFSFDEDFDFELDDDKEDDKEDDDFDDLLDLSDDAETFDTETSDDMDEEIDLGLEDLMDDGDAIDTKLDLAKAYLEMGDVEGAKNLLDEVMSEGSDSQIEDAKKIIDDM